MTKGGNKYNLSHTSKDRLCGQRELLTTITHDPEATVMCKSILLSLQSINTVDVALLLDQEKYSTVALVLTEGVHLVLIGGRDFT